MVPPRTTRHAHRRPRLAALLATAAVASVILAGCSDDTTEATDPATTGPTAPTTPATPDTGAATTDTTGTPPSSTAAEDTVSVPVYLVGDTPQGPRLYREFHRVPASDPLGGAAAVLTSGEVSDPDYRSPYTGGSFSSVVDQGGQIVATVDGAGPVAAANPTPRQAKLATQALVYTLQGAAQTRDRVFVRDAAGAAVPLVGVDTSQGLRNAKELNVLALVSVTTPEQGATASGSLSATGVASSYEGTVPWEVLDASGASVLDGSAQAEGYVDGLYPWTADLDLSGLAPGDYTFVARTDDPSGGEGGGPTEDTKSFTVS